MVKVFISGSSTISVLPEAVKDKLDDWIGKGYAFVVGDCKGVDTSVQAYLNSKGCKNVTVYYSYGYTDKGPRNNPYAFPVKGIHSTGTGRSFYTTKDIAMTEDCDIALVLWDGKSAGSKANRDRSIQLGKKVAVYVTGHDEYWQIYNK